MAVPKKKTSKRRRDNRRSHHNVKEVKTVKCKHCGKQKKPHTICTCGKY